MSVDQSLNLAALCGDLAAARAALNSGAAKEYKDQVRCGR
jgi:hypothetical protein